jgi:hypothetical protein
MDGINTATKGNQINNWNETDTSDAAFDPGKLITSESFDLEIYQKTGTTASDIILVAKLRDCRMTRKGGGINKRGILVESMSFNAILLDHGNVGSDAVSNSGDIDLS